MRRVVLTGPHARLRARRWDVLVLGSALPGLVAAIRIAMQRLRVLLVEEETAAQQVVPLREPFFLAGASSGGILDACLRTLGLALIDRRRLRPEPLAYQIVFPEARVNLGPPAVTIEEFVAWGLAKPEEARELVRGLKEAAAAERSALLAAPIVRLAARRALAPRPRTRRHARGLPCEAAQPPAPLAPLLDAQVRALANVASPTAPPEAKARLLGAALEGAASFPSAEDSLRGLLQRRLVELHGEIRSLAGRFELVCVEDQPGLAPRSHSGELWLGRALVVNAPRARLSTWLRACGSEPPPFLAYAGQTRRRLSVRMQARPEIVPEGMSRRVIHVGNPSRPVDDTNLITLGLSPERGGQAVTVVASTLLAGARGREREAARQLEGAVRELMPFAEGSLTRPELAASPQWDDEAWLEDPQPGAGWPGDAELRVSARPPVYRLPREEVGCLGLEGDMLLGWRAGDAIRAALA